ncbi:MAG TPA: ATP-binding cassette domain-containing protein [Myxococcota bacterium]|nr:ATP-binding cassette domain-containing protein [Myxococcota bacterium]
MSEPAFELEDVWFAYGEVPVLEGVSLAVEPNDYLAVLGPNGSGKTTLVKLLLGLLRPARGRVQVLGTDPVRARGRVGYVPQRTSFDLDFPIRVADVVRMGRLSRAGLGRRLGAADRAAVDRALATVELTALANRPIGALSGGQLQRVLIARALALEPELLLLDEPTASLDERIGSSVWELLQSLSERLTVVVISHDIGAISRHVRTVACLNRRLHAHPSRELTPEILEATYGCPIDLIAHGHPHRVLPPHEHGGGKG